MSDVAERARKVIALSKEKDKIEKEIKEKQERIKEIKEELEALFEISRRNVAVSIEQKTDIKKIDDLTIEVPFDLTFDLAAERELDTEEFRDLLAALDMKEQLKEDYGLTEEDFEVDDD